MLVCHRTQGRKWFTRSPGVPDGWFPKDELDVDSFAFGVLYGGGQDDAIPHRVGADVWFDRWEAARFDVLEQTIRTADDEVLTLVLFSDPRMLEERDERQYRRFR